MVKRKAANAASWVGKKLLSIVILAGLLMVMAIPVVIFTQAGISETWAYLALAGFLLAITGIMVWCIVWGLRKASIYEGE